MAQSSLKQRVGLCILMTALLGVCACEDDDKSETKDPCSKCTADQTCVDQKCVDKDTVEKCGDEVCTDKQKCENDRCVDIGDEPDPDQKCGGEVCSETQKCENDRCVDKETPDPDSCGGTKCLDNQKCVSDACRDLCGADVCQDGEKCVESECKPLCGTTVCGEGEACEEGVCIATCGGEICTNEQECDEATDKCVPLGCSGVQCGDNEVCNAGECLCGDIKCEENEACSDEFICESTADKCENVICDIPNQTCNEKTGACDCGGVTCNDGEYCDESGKCIEGDPCEGIECTDGETCVVGQCICKGAGEKCEEGKTCEYDVCVDNECVGKTCDEGLVCAKGDCIEPACVGVSCENGLSCSGGDCVDAACIGVECPTDRTCKEGACRLGTEPKIKVINATGDITSEDGTETVRLAVFLDTKPIKDVTISAQIDDVSEAEVSGAESITFTSEDFEDAKYFTIVGIKDAMIDGDQPYKVKLTSESEDLDFNGLTKEIDLTNRDDDKAAVVMNLPESLMTTESGGSVTIGVSLSVQPDNDVNIIVMSSNTAEGTLNVGSLKFDAANWDQPQELVVTGMDDATQDGNVAYQVTFAVTSEDAHFNELEVTPIDLVNADNDQAGLAVSASSLTINEAATGVIKVNLNTKPSKTVTVSAVSATPTAATVSPATLTFTEDNYNKQQTFTVTGVHDNKIAGDKMSEITIKTDDTAPEYKGMSAKVTALVKEIDKASIILDGCPTSLKEGAAGKCQARLSAEPSKDVKLAITSSNTKEMTVSPATMTFTNQNWNKNQAITLTGVKDQLIDGSKNVSLKANATSNDTNFSGKAASKTIEIADINSATITATCSNQALSEANVSTTYNCKVRLNAKPTKDVTLAFKSTDTTEVKLTAVKSGVANLFTGKLADGKIVIKAANWTNVDDSYIQFNYVAVDDTQADGTQTAYLQFDSTSNDTNFNKKQAKPKITVTDNETPGIVISSPGALKCGTNSTGSIKLAAQPTGTVTVNLKLNNTDGLSLSKSSFQFTTSNYNTAQKFTVNTRANGNTAPKKAYYKAVTITGTVASTVGTYTTSVTKSVSVAYTAFCAVNLTTAGATGTINLPKGSFNITARGGKGGGVNADMTKPHGGMPAIVKGRLDLTAAQTVSYAIGGQGASCYNKKECGGSNGGGKGSYSTNSNNAGYGGGGATELVGAATYDYKKRILIAAGGGGSSNKAGASNGGQAGTLVNASNGAYDGTHKPDFAKAAGATNSKKYLFGDSISTNNNGAGGGGAGWNGGQAGQMKAYSGAAGESFAFTGVNDAYKKKGGTFTDDTFSLVSTSIATESDTGKTINGYLKITAIATEPN